MCTRRGQVRSCNLLILTAHSMSPQCKHRSRWCASCRGLLRNLHLRGNIRIAVGLEALENCRKELNKITSRPEEHA